MSGRSFDDPTSIEARQALLDNRCEHKPKNHRTLKRRKSLSAKKRQRIKHAVVIKLEAYRKRKDRVRRYWSQGDIDHPK